MKNVKAKLITGALSLQALFFSTYAMAIPKISDWATGWKSETKAILGAGLFIFMALGVGVACWSVYSAIMTKKQDRPLSWQLFGVFGGSVMIIVPALLIALSGSITSGSSNAETTMSELGVTY